MSLVLNASLLGSYGDDWAARSSEERRAFELLAGSPEAAAADPEIRPAPFSPDVRLADIPWLVAEGAIAPRPVADEADAALLAAALAGRVGVTPP